jgi:hypothetical protein
MVFTCDRAGHGLGGADMKHSTTHSALERLLQDVLEPSTEQQPAVDRGQPEA